MALSVLVTGGYGFVGQSLRRELNSHGVRVILLTRKSSSQTSLHPNESHLYGDLESLDFADSSLRSVDTIFHLAWSNTHAYLSQHHLGNELELQKRFLRKWAESEIPHMNAFGSCYEYGKQNGQLRETDICQPNTPYGESKLRLLEFLDETSMSEGKDYSWFRCFYLFGSGQPAGTLWNEICSWSLGGSPIVLNDPHRMLDFVPIHEAAWITSTIGLARMSTSILNIGLGRPRTVQAQAHYIASTLGIPATFEVPDQMTGRSRTYESSGSWADPTRLFQYLNISKNVIQHHRGGREI